MKDSWSTEEALKIGKAKTRDGRFVLGLKLAVLDGRQVLVGDITIKKRGFKADQTLLLESHYWEAGGLGRHGGDDLVPFRT